MKYGRHVALLQFCWSHGYDNWWMQMTLPCTRVYIILLFRMTGRVTVAVNLTLKMNLRISECYWRSHNVVKCWIATESGELEYFPCYFKCNLFINVAFSIDHWSLVMSGVHGILSMTTTSNIQSLCSDVSTHLIPLAPHLWFMKCSVS